MKHRLPRKLKKRLKMTRIKHFKALLKTEGLSFKEFTALSAKQLKERIFKNLTEWHNTTDLMSDNIKPMPENRKWSGRIW